MDKTACKTAPDLLTRTRVFAGPVPNSGHPDRTQPETRPLRQVKQGLASYLRLDARGEICYPRLRPSTPFFDMPDDELTLEEYKRYGRQMILEGFGLPGESSSMRINTGSSSTRSAQTQKCTRCCDRRRWSRLPGTSVSGRSGRR